MSKEVKHTPGPWSTVFNEGRDGAYTCSIVDLTFAKDTGYIADVYHNHIGSFISREEYEANARLIAAAPELLEAISALLNRYVELVNSGDAGFWDPETEEEVINARAAISKAEGTDK